MQSDSRPQNRHPVSPKQALYLPPTPTTSRALWDYEEGKILFPTRLDRVGYLREGLLNVTTVGITVPVDSSGLKDL